MKALIAAVLIAASGAFARNAEFYQYVMPSRSEMVYDLNNAIMERNAATSAYVFHYWDNQVTIICYYLGIDPERTIPIRRAISASDSPRNFPPPDEGRRFFCAPGA
jgi:hypothetical protein